VRTGAVVGIVVLNWNGREDTLRCLRSLEQVTYPDLVVVVVDNGSTDGSVEAIRASHPNVDVLPLGRNTGFTGGNNAGLEELQARGVDILGVLNNDTAVTRGFLEPLVAALENHPDAFLSPRIVYLDDPERAWFAVAAIEPYNGTVYHLAEESMPTAARDVELRPTPAVPGCALFATRALWERVGLFDDRYFLLLEDSDWCARALEVGAHGYVVTASTISHAVSSSFIASRSAAADYYYCRNGLLYLRTHGPKPGWNTYYFLKGQLITALRALLRERSKAALRAVAARLEGILDAVLGHWSARRWYWMDTKP